MAVVEYTFTHKQYTEQHNETEYPENNIPNNIPPSGGTCKYAKAPSTKKTWRDSLPIDMLLSAVSVLVVAQSSSEIPEGIMNNTVYIYIYICRTAPLTSRRCILNIYSTNIRTEYFKHAA